MSAKPTNNCTDETKPECAYLELTASLLLEAFRVTTAQKELNSIPIAINKLLC